VVLYVVTQVLSVLNNPDLIPEDRGDTFLRDVANNIKTTRRHNTEVYKLHLHRHESLKSPILTLLDNFVLVAGITYRCVICDDCHE
jgi:hypothetical protein